MDDGAESAGRSVDGRLTRRGFARGTARVSSLAPAALRTSAAAADAPIRIGTTAVILDDQVGFLRRVARATSRQRSGVRSRLRATWQLPRDHRADHRRRAGFRLGVRLSRTSRNRASMRLLAMPLYRRQAAVSVLSDRAELATRARKASRDLAGKMFAYSDPNSNSGFLVPQYRCCARARPADAVPQDASSLRRTARW